jgi:hypothetical protein
MDRAVAGSPVPADPTDLDARGDSPSALSEFAGEPAPIASSLSGDSDEAIDLQRQIEALKAFLDRYPPPAPLQPIETPTADAPAAIAGEQELESQPSPDADAPSESIGASVADVPPAAPLSVDRSHGLLASSSVDERPRLFPTRRHLVIAGISVAAVLAVVAFVGVPFRSAAREAARTGTLSVSTSPSGIAVFVDGTPRDVTPVTVDLAPGDHVLELLIGSERRRIPVKIAAGAQVTHFLELPPVNAAMTEMPVSPPIPAVPTAGSSDSNEGGWVSVSAPSDVQVHENGRILGSSRIDRIMLPVGRHQLEFVNETLGYRAVQSVEVVGGEVVPVKLRWPQGSVALNAVPWAEVFVDGQSVGETPIGNLTLPIGVHEVVFQHPELGERRATITVTVGKPTTLGVDLGAK